MKDNPLFYIMDNFKELVYQIRQSQSFHPISRSNPSTLYFIGGPLDVTNIEDFERFLKDKFGIQIVKSKDVPDIFSGIYFTNISEYLLVPNSFNKEKEVQRLQSFLKNKKNSDNLFRIKYEMILEALKSS